jgi:hypothetical protein
VRLYFEYYRLVDPKSETIMRLFLIMACGILSGSALAETVFVEASQDNTLYEHSQGTLRSNGAGRFLFAGKTINFGVRRALLAFKDLGAVPAGASISSVKLHLYVSKENAPQTTVRVRRLDSDWGEGTSDATSAEGQGAQAAAGDATWNHTFFDNMTWTTPGGDFAAVASAQIVVDMVGAYTVESTSGLVADVQHWLDNPGENYGWILIANENTTSARRFNSREHGTVERRPTIEIEYSTPTAPAPLSGDFSGAWFDPELDGEGYLIFNTPIGWLIYYFGYTADEKRLWLISDIVNISNLVPGTEYEFNMVVGTPGSFAAPTPSTELEVWGLLTILLFDCNTGVFTLEGIDGLKVSNVLKLIGVNDTTCGDDGMASIGSD